MIHQCVREFITKPVLPLESAIQLGTYPSCQRRWRVNLFTQLANDATHLPPVRQAARKYCCAVRQAARCNRRNHMSLNLTWYLIVSAIIFTVGVTGVLIRRNPLIIFMSIELMLNAVNLSFIAFSHYLNSVD